MATRLSLEEWRAVYIAARDFPTLVRNVVNENPYKISIYNLHPTADFTPRLSDTAPYTLRYNAWCDKPVESPLKDTSSFAPYKNRGWFNANGPQAFRYCSVLYTGIIIDTYVDENDHVIKKNTVGYEDDYGTTGYTNRLHIINCGGSMSCGMTITNGTWCPDEGGIANVY